MFLDQYSFEPESRYCERGEPHPGAKAISFLIVLNEDKRLRPFMGRLDKLIPPSGVTVLEVTVFPLPPFPLMEKVEPKDQANSKDGSFVISFLLRIGFCKMLVFEY
jgi:hypothetical protein